MNKNTVSGDIVDWQLRQMGASNITFVNSNMYIVDFKLNTAEIAEFIEKDLSRFRNAEHSSNFDKFIEISKKGAEFAEALENLFLNYNVDKDEMERMDEKLDKLLEHLEQAREKAAPIQMP